MERRVAGRVLGFLIGSAGVVLAVFVVLPWLETPQQSAHQPEPRDASLEEVLASFGIEEAGEESDTGDKTAEEPAISFDFFVFGADGGRRTGLHRRNGPDGSGRHRMARR